MTHDADSITVGLIPSVRFWEIPTPSAVLTACHGEPLLLAAWVTLAGMHRTDAAFRRPGRHLSELAHALGLSDPAQVVPLIAGLTDRGLLDVVDGYVRIPWADLQVASLEDAGRQMDAAGLRPSAAPAPDVAAHQAPLPGLDDE